MDLNQFSTVDIVLDKANDNIIQKQTISAGDRDGRSLTLQVTDAGSIGEVPGLTANLLWTNHSSDVSDLSAFSVVDRATSVFKINYPQNMLTAGKVTAQIQLLHNGKVTHSKKFEIIVLDIAGKLKGVLQSAEYTALVEALAKTNGFETDIAEVSAQLAQTNNMLNSKADRSEIGSPLVATSIAGMTDKTRVYVNTSDGNWYSHNGSNWVSGGVYQSQGVGQHEVTSPKIADGAITPRKNMMFTKISTNLINPETSLEATSIDFNTGEPVFNASNSLSDFIEVEPGQQIIGNSLTRRAFYDINKNFIGHNATDINTQPYTIPNNCYFVRIVFQGALPQLNLGSVLLPYEPYYAYTDSRFIEDKSLASYKVSNLSLPTHIVSTNTSRLFNFDFINKVISATDVYLLIGSQQTMINVSLDIGELATTALYVLYYDLETESLGTKLLAQIATFPIPETAIKIAIFRLSDNLVDGLENYLINGQEPMNTKDEPVSDVSIGQTFDSNVTIPSQKVEIDNHSSSSIYQMYDELVDLEPSYITKKLEGNEPSVDSIPIYSYTFKPSRPRSSTINSPEPKKIKLFFTSGVHPEGMGIYNLYNIMYNVVHNWQDNEILEFLRFNCEIIVIPCASAWSVDNRSRTNVNGVDMNRNMPAGWVQGTFGSNTYGGPEPLSEPEAQIMYNILVNNPDLTAYIDFHNYNRPANDYDFMWVICNDVWQENIAKSHIQRIDRKWKKKYDWINQSHQDFIGYTGGLGIEGSVSRQAHQFNIPSVTYETSWRVYAKPDSSNVDADVSNLGYETIVDFLSLFLNETLKRKI